MGSGMEEADLKHVLSGKVLPDGIVLPKVCLDCPGDELALSSLTDCDF